MFAVTRSGSQALDGAMMKVIPTSACQEESHVTIPMLTHLLLIFFAFYANPTESMQGAVCIYFSTVLMKEIASIYLAIKLPSLLCIVINVVVLYLAFLLFSKNCGISY